MVLGATSHPLRAFFRWWFSKQLRHLCAGACAVTYVTEHALQKRYPCPGYSVGVSDVDLPPSAFVTEPRKPHTDSKPLRLILVGSLAELYKAPHILIDAFSRCINDGFNLELVFVGDGKHRSELEAQAKRLGLAKRVVFCGQLSNDQVQSQLDQADLFILASIQEGLPRAMVEAMARGLPCIGSTVGGIPELLPAEDLVPSGDTDALARKINEVVSNSERMECMSKQNLARASDFREELLMAKWSEFYNYLKERTQEWLAANARQDSFT